MMRKRGLEGLTCWEESKELAVFVCRHLLPLFPLEEKWALASQLRRSIQSIPANIAEAHGRYYYQERVRFGYISRGSLDESYSHIQIAFELGYLDKEQFIEVCVRIRKIRKLLNGYINYIKRSRRGENEPGCPSDRVPE
jgi:four helix bundle protein